MIAELNVLIYADRDGLLSGRILREDGCSNWPIDPDNQGFMSEVVADEVNEAIERLGFRKPRAWSTREGAFAWCTCLGWIATLQRTAELAYWCGADDADDDNDKTYFAAAIGAEQVRVAAKDAGLVPGDPDPFAFGDCQPAVDGDGLPCLLDLSARYDMDHEADLSAHGWSRARHVSLSPRSGPDLWRWMVAHPGEKVEPTDDFEDGYVVSGFEWRWRGRFEATGPHVAWYPTTGPNCACVPVRGYWGEE